MESVKTGKTNKVGKNTEMANTKANKEAHFKQASTITNIIRSIRGIFTKIAKKVRGLVKKHPKKSSAALVVLTHIACKKAKELDDKVQDKSKQAEKENQINWWKYSGLTIATSLLLAACSTGDVSEQIELEQEKQKTSNIETNNQIKVEQEKQKTSNIETNNQIKVEQEQQKTSNTQKDLVKEQKDLVKEQKDLVKEQKDLVKEQKDLVKTQKDFIKYVEQNCQENHNQFFIEKGGIKAGIGIEVEAECKTPKPAKTNQTPIQPKHLPNSKQPRSQRGSKAQELIAYLQKELEFLPYSQKAIAKQVDFYRPSSIAYLELDPRDFKVTEEWQKENLKIRSKAQAKMLEMRNPQAHLSNSQSLLFVQKIFADVNKEIEAVANTEKKAEKAGYGYSKRM
ncbi:hypothetical protein C2844_00630 [Helicobacter pylori]|uniref:DUF874 family protein n=8 Tax=Helicobacter pylori TaxID=210 RepID=A0AAN1JXR3_HELPX|nr:DUF874 family protein [Helicobacter pylori]AUV74355.1 hypothetical protein C2841_00630 [Helicobacter pylori]AUV75864.1 hypothetical protein C2843_00630 [Helicobacter pylori]AUV77341.1 hypothetical protein C2840_00630 [Helicobacter pylori]AUV78848.1 hypothetical protein C2842_00630 [Helicobacter pylori]AUZ23369.1 hypothetical protein C2844_00630 [Helicobacter pylori]